jgi:hypothetical protein
VRCFCTSLSITPVLNLTTKPHGDTTLIDPIYGAACLAAGLATLGWAVLTGFKTRAKVETLESMVGKQATSCGENAGKTEMLGMKIASMETQLTAKIVSLEAQLTTSQREMHELNTLVRMINEKLNVLSRLEGLMSGLQTILDKVVPREEIEARFSSLANLVHNNTDLIRDGAKGKI